MLQEESKYQNITMLILVLIVVMWVRVRWCRHGDCGLQWADGYRHQVAAKVTGLGARLCGSGLNIGLKDYLQNCFFYRVLHRGQQ